jgi:hypothetical protein
MQTATRICAAVALIIGASTAIVEPSLAAPIGQPLAIARPNSDVTQVWWRGGWGWGPGAVIGGLAAGAIVGGAIASSPYYYGNPYYGPPPAYRYGPPPGDAVAYCMQRYRSYDPNSGTFLGNDGHRHPCP